MKETVKAYVDLLRLHFFFVWPILFCSGLFLAFANYGGFSIGLVIKAALIGFFGFEAGMVLNDYIDRNLDRKDVEQSLTKYWRPFGKRPMATGQISEKAALSLFIIFALIAFSLILTLPYPNSIYVLAIMAYAYSAEYFYQIRKRKQNFPLAQIIGRTDFALFPIAGYLCLGAPDLTALLYLLFFYPWAEAHLGVNDLADERNDKARGMKTVTTLYDRTGTAWWILGFTLTHAVASVFFMSVLGNVARIGIFIGLILLSFANYLIAKNPVPETALKVLPVFHLSLLVYSVSIILSYFI